MGGGHTQEGVARCILTYHTQHRHGEGCAEFDEPCGCIVRRATGGLDGLADEGDLLFIRPRVDHVDNVENHRACQHDAVTCHLR